MSFLAPAKTAIARSLNYTYKFGQGNLANVLIVVVERAGSKIPLGSFEIGTFPCSRPWHSTPRRWREMRHAKAMQQSPNEILAPCVKKSTEVGGAEYTRQIDKLLRREAAKWDLSWRPKICCGTGNRDSKKRQCNEGILREMTCQALLFTSPLLLHAAEF